MENRRPPGNNPEKPLNRGSNYKKTGDSSYGPRTFQPRNDRFQSRDNNQRENNNQRDNRFPPREGGQSQPPRDDRFQSRDGRFQPRENKFPPRRDDGGDRIQSRDTRYARRDEPGRDNRSENRSDNRSGGFAPRRSFIPRGKPQPDWKNVEKPRIYDEMQITDGKHIGKFMKTTDSPRVRPTVRRVRETLFKLIFRRVRAGRFLDLCAGAGTVGIEAISRGALLCSFVERSAKMCGIIKKNLESLGVKTGHGEVFQIEAVPFLKQMAKRRRFWDVVFFDPPYDTNYDEVLSYLSRGVGIKPGGMLVIEHHAEMFFPERLGILTRSRVVAAGETSLSFYERK
ncbi:MAG: 16S rRNA (guanine(966)-N(2))-methyltransferase RsmD [Pyrinomonadaceae bacterium]